MDLIKMKAVIYNESSLGSLFEEGEIPKGLVEKAKKYRTDIFEAVAEYDEALLEKYLEGAEISEAELVSAIRKATIDVKIIPLLCGSAFKNKGVQRLLDAIIAYLPSPPDLKPIEGRHPRTNEIIFRKNSVDDPFSALAFKVMTDPYVGRLTFFRVYSGSAKAGTYLYNTNTDKK